MSPSERNSAEPRRRNRRIRRPRPRSAPALRPPERTSIAPRTPQRPQPAICQGVQGPWPNQKLETSAVRAPTAKPGAPPPAAGEDHHVGGRLDVGEGGEGDPAGDRQRRQRRDQGDDLRGRPRALVPAKPATRTAPRIRKLTSSQDSSALPPGARRGALLGVMTPGTSSTRATSVAKYQPPERTCGRAVGDQDPVAEQDDPRGEGGGELDVVGGDDDPGTAAGELPDQLDEVPLRARSIPRVGSSRATRPAAPRPRSARPARSPAPAAGARRRRDRADRRPPACSRPTARSAAAPAPRQLVPDPLADQVVAGMLGQQRNPPGLRSTPNRLEQPGRGAQQGALAGPVRPISATRSPGSTSRSIPLQDLVRARRPRSSSTHRSRARSAGWGIRAAARGGDPFRRSARCRSRPNGAGASTDPRLLHVLRRVAARSRRARRAAPPASQEPGRASGPRRGSRAGRRRRRSAPESIAITRSAAARQRSSRCSRAGPPTPTPRSAAAAARSARPRRPGRAGRWARRAGPAAGG